MSTPLQLLQSRHSVRAFSTEEIPAPVLNKLRAEATMTNTHEQGMRFQIVTDDPDPFRGFSKSYGIFTNPRCYLAAVVDTATPDALERAGYFAEKFVMKAVELGLATCFVGGTYDGKQVKVQIRAGEKILFLVLFGLPLGKTRLAARMMAGLVHLRKMQPRQFFSPEDALDRALEQFPSLRTGLQAVACAPSALNRRPVRLFVGGDESAPCICAKVNPGNPRNLIDLGIAKFNYNYATSSECLWGNGAPLESC